MLVFAVSRPTQQIDIVTDRAPSGQCRELFYHEPQQSLLHFYCCRWPLLAWAYFHGHHFRRLVASH